MARKILFVDDDEILQLIVERGFAASGDSFELFFARDGFEALKKLENVAVSLIVIDLHMPRMDGLSLLSHVLQGYPDIPVVLISATPRTQVAYLLQMQGIVGYLEKPFAVDELAVLINETLQAEAAGGVMYSVSPTMFLQLMEMEGKTCTIRIVDRDSDEGGILYLRDGQLLDARIGDLRGIDGAYRVFNWDEVDVFFRNDCPERDNQINSDLQAIIMGGLAAKDEADDSPFADLEGPIAGFASLSDDDGPTSGCTPVAGDQEGRPLANSPEAFRARIREMLRRELGDFPGLVDPEPAPKLDRAIGALQTIGELSGFGPVRVMHVDRDAKGSMLLLPDELESRALVMPLEDGAPLISMLDVLRYRD